MKRYLLKIMFGIGCFMIAFQSTNVFAESGSQGWLIGTWELAFDPDNNPKDWLVFEEGKQAAVRWPDGRSISGTYRVTNDTVTLFVIAGSKSLQIPLSVSENGERLTNSTGAYYIKSIER